MANKIVNVNEVVANSLKIHFYRCGNGAFALFISSGIISWRPVHEWRPPDSTLLRNFSTIQRQWLNHQDYWRRR
jgi:hypothetical protein